MKYFIKSSGYAAGQAVVAAAPVIVGAAIAEPVLLAVMAGAGILVVGIVLGVGIIWVTQTVMLQPLRELFEVGGNETRL